ncbi:MAG: cytochrome c family protein [Thermodesulfovibrionales bacterium]|nr:cytochrome c family protein [Thermodesulfovibrionales bacterium]
MPSIINLSLGLAETKSRLPKYVGSEACKDCHEKEYISFMTYAKKATSFKSIERLEKKLTEEEIKGCYSCHATGYGKPGGFISPEKTPHLKNAGCEVCHGPGEFHVKTKNPSYIKRHLTTKDCDVCHTEERVKAFRYRPMIHGGAH